MNKPYARLEVFWVALLLGLRSFGGPIAHLAYFHAEYVRKRDWLDERMYAELVALCQVLPGPASSQLGMAIGTLRAGIAGGLLAFLGFTLPSALALTGFAFYVEAFDVGLSAALHGLKIVAFAVVLQAVLVMWQKLVSSRILAAIALSSAFFLLVWPSALNQVVLMAAAALFALFTQPRTTIEQDTSPIQLTYSLKIAYACLALFMLLFLALPMLRTVNDHPLLALADGFYRAGALVFGGGHVVLPLLEQAVVPAGMVSAEVFTAGYGAAQAVPGPLFTFAAYLGAAAQGLPGAFIGLLAIFLPGYLLIIGVLPFWSALRRHESMLRALAGVNAAVVGILLAALYNPLWNTAIHQPSDLALALVLILMLMVWKVPPLIVVLTGIGGALGLHALGWG